MVPTRCAITNKSDRLEGNSTDCPLITFVPLKVDRTSVAVSLSLKRSNKSSWAKRDDEPMKTKINIILTAVYIIVKAAFTVT